MNLFTHGRLGHYLMNEAGTDGGDAGGASPAAPAAEPGAAPEQPSEPAGSLLGDQIKSGDGADKPDDQAKPDGAKEGDDNGTAGAPDVYESFTLPEGAELDEKALPMVQDLFKELNLPQDKAQAVLNKLLEIDAARQPTAEQAEQMRAQAYEQGIQNLNKQWTEECRKLPELGGDNFSKSLEVASSVMVKYAPPELRDFLTNSGLGSHPEFFKFIHAIGSAMRNDTMEHGGEATPGSKDPGSLLWPNLTK